jgi:peptidoglycan/LPS O-acetylase OafA/YrhL
LHVPLLNGGLAVLVFFFVSGFALSTPFVLGGGTTSIIRTAAGRYLRLALPVFVARLAAHLLLLAVSRRAGGIAARAWLAATASRLVDAADAPAGSLDAQRAAERIDRRAAEPP